MQFKVNLAKGTNWQATRFMDAIAYGAEQHGTAQWSTQQGNIEIVGPQTEDGQNFFIFVELAGYEALDIPLGFLSRYQFVEGGNYGVLAVNDFQKNILR